MADFSQLYDLGPGTSYTKGVLDPDVSRGVITAFRTTGVVDAEDLADQAGSIFPSTYPGDSTVPLNQVAVKLLGGGQALFIGYYGRSRRGQFDRRLQIEPRMRTATTYVWPDGTPVEEMIDPITSLLKPRTIFVPQRRIAWTGTLYQDTRPDLQISLDGTINNNSYTIEGYTFSAGYLLFAGMSLIYDKWGAYDRWYLRYEAIFDSGQWKDGALDTSTYPGTPKAVNLYPDNLYVTWPALPPS